VLFRSTTPGPVKTLFDDLSAQMQMTEDLHTSQRTMVAVLRPDLSYNPRQNVGKARYVAITTLRVKPGHMSDFMKVAQLYIGALRKMKGDDHWALYQVVGGGRDDVFMSVSSMESLAEMDAMIARGGDFARAMGDDMDDFEQAVARSLDPIDTMIYAINPQMSHVPAEIMDADRAFWSAPLPAPTPAPARARPASARRRGQQ
jgi:quinol monooxygenase YgiN